MMPFPRVRCGNRHHRHRRHQPLRFNGLAVTQGNLPPSPDSPLCVTRRQGDGWGDGLVTVLPQSFVT